MRTLRFYEAVTGLKSQAASRARRVGAATVCPKLSKPRAPPTAGQASSMEAIHDLWKLRAAQLEAVSEIIEQSDETMNGPSCRGGTQTSMRPHVVSSSPPTEQETPTQPHDYVHESLLQCCSTRLERRITPCRKGGGREALPQLDRRARAIPPPTATASEEYSYHEPSDPDTDSDCGSPSPPPTTTAKKKTLITSRVTRTKTLIVGRRRHHRLPQPERKNTNYEPSDTNTVSDRSAPPPTATASEENTYPNTDSDHRSPQLANDFFEWDTCTAIFDQRVRIAHEDVAELPLGVRPGGNTLPDRRGSRHSTGHGVPDDILQRVRDVHADGSEHNDGGNTSDSEEFYHTSDSTVRPDAGTRCIGDGGKQGSGCVHIDEINADTTGGIQTGADHRQPTTARTRAALLNVDAQADVDAQAENLVSDGTDWRRTNSGSYPLRTVPRDRQERHQMETTLEMGDPTDGPNESGIASNDTNDTNDTVVQSRTPSRTSDCSDSDEDRDVGSDDDDEAVCGGGSGLYYSTGRRRIIPPTGQIAGSGAASQPRPLKRMSEALREMTDGVDKSNADSQPDQDTQARTRKPLLAAKASTKKQYLPKRPAVVQPQLSQVMLNLHPQDTAMASVLSRMCILSESAITKYQHVYAALLDGNRETINAEQLQSGLQTVCQDKVHGEEIDFVVEVLDLLQGDGQFPSETVDFEQFMMAAALSESIVNLSPEVRKMINCDDLAQQKRKAILMFFIDANEDCMLTLEDLSALMDAGRIDEGQKQVFLGHFGKCGDSITFLQYLSHLPLFLQLHREIVENTLEGGTRRLV